MRSARQLAVAMYPVDAQIYDTLVRMDEHFQLQPELADRSEYQGNSTWRFTLHTGVKFHDGQLFNADTLKGTFDRVAQWSNGGSIPVCPNAVKKVDAYAVDITSTQPNLRMPEQLTHPTHRIIASASDPATKQVGTGPFKFGEYLKAQRLVVDRTRTTGGRRHSGNGSRSGLRQTTIRAPWPCGRAKSTRWLTSRSIRGCFRLTSSSDVMIETFLRPTSPRPP